MPETQRQDADCVRIGFSGTRKGMTPQQRETVEELLDGERVDEVHHGDCVGADANFHDMCCGRYPIVIHPPSEVKLRAFCKDAEVRPSKGYLARNRDIVDETDELIATPRAGSEEWQTGGTWYTVNYARQRGKPVTVVYADGSAQGWVSVDMSQRQSDGQVSDG